MLKIVYNVSIFPHIKKWLVLQLSLPNSYIDYISSQKETHAWFPFYKVSLQRMIAINTVLSLILSKNEL